MKPDFNRGDTVRYPSLDRRGIFECTINEMKYHESGCRKGWTYTVGSKKLSWTFHDKESFILFLDEEKCKDKYRESKIKEFNIDMEKLGKEEWKIGLTPS